MPRLQEYHIRKVSPDLPSMFKSWLKKQPVQWIIANDATTVIKKFKRSAQLPDSIDSLKLVCVEIIKQHLKKNEEYNEKRARQKAKFWF